MTVSNTLTFAIDPVPTTAISNILPLLVDTLSTVAVSNALTFTVDAVPTTAISTTLAFTSSFSTSRIFPRQIRTTSTPGFLLQLDASGYGVVQRARWEGVTVASIGPASIRAQLAYVTDEVGGPTLAFSDGTVWRRWQDRAQIST